MNMMYFWVSLLARLKLRMSLKLLLSMKRGVTTIKHGNIMKR